MIDYWGTNTTFQEVELSRAEVADDDYFTEFFKQRQVEAAARRADVAKKWAAYDKLVEKYSDAEVAAIRAYRSYLQAGDTMNDEWHKPTADREALRAAYGKAWKRYERAQAIAKKYKEQLNQA